MQPVDGIIESLISDKKRVQMCVSCHVGVPRSTRLRFKPAV